MDSNFKPVNITDIPIPRELEKQMTLEPADIKVFSMLLNTHFNNTKQQFEDLKDKLVTDLGEIQRAEWKKLHDSIDDQNKRIEDCLKRTGNIEDFVYHSKDFFENFEKKANDVDNVINEFPKLKSDVEEIKNKFTLKWYGVRIAMIGVALIVIILGLYVFLKKHNWITYFHAEKSANEKPIQYNSRNSVNLHYSNIKNMLQ